MIIYINALLSSLFIRVCIVHPIVPCLGHMYVPFGMQWVPLPLGTSGIPKEQLHVCVICDLHKVALPVLVVQSDVVVHHGLPKHMIGREGDTHRGEVTFNRPSCSSGTVDTHRGCI